MKFTETAVDGCWIIDLTPFGDERGGFARTFLIARRAQGTSADNFAPTHTSMYCFGTIVSSSGINTTTALDVTASMEQGSTTGTGQNAPAPSLSPVTNGAHLIHFRHSWDGAAVTPPAGYTERVEGASYVCDRVQTTAAPTGVVNVPSGNTAGTKPYVISSIALRDAAAVEPPPYEPLYQDQIELAQAGTGQVRAVILADSYGEGEGSDEREFRWVDLWHNDSRVTLGIAGTGLGHTPPRYNTYMAESANWRAPATPRNNVGTVVPLANKVFTRAAGESFSYTFTGTGFTVVYDGGAGLGSISVAVDGGSAETIAAQASGRGHRWNKTGLTAGSHTVVLTAGTGGARPIGINTYNGGDSPTNGMTYLDWCWTGGTSDQWGPGGPYDITALGSYGAHVVIDGQNGANDHLRDVDPMDAFVAPTPAVVGARLTARINVARSWSTKPLYVVYILPMMPAGSAVDESQVNSQGYVLNDYRNAIRAAAEAFETGVLVVDLRELMTLTLDDLASDNLHMEVQGQQAVATAIRSTLLEAAGYTPLPQFYGDLRIGDIFYGDTLIPVVKLQRGDTVLWER